QQNKALPFSRYKKLPQKGLCGKVFLIGELTLILSFSLALRNANALSFLSFLIVEIIIASILFILSKKQLSNYNEIINYHTRL
ncbi:MAG: hypothetical protein ABIC04_00480, partial [Nanoarchaeota archaeon]